MDETAVALVLKALGLGDAGEVRACPHCRGEALTRWGGASAGRQRWRCKGCGRTFGANTGTAACGLREPSLFERAVRDMLGEAPSSCRGLARLLGVQRMTVWQWRRKVHEVLMKLRIAAAGVMGARLVTRESRKASREWVRYERAPKVHARPNRERWVDYARGRLPLPAPMRPYLLASRLGVDGGGGWWAGVRPVEGDAGPAGCGQGDAVLRDGLRAFLGQFRGPAARYLEGYVAWYAARLAGGQEGRDGGKSTQSRDMSDVAMSVHHDTHSVVLDVAPCPG